MKRIYIIAGEPSGDFLGSFVMRALREKSAGISISGVGGSLMEKEGLKSLFDIEQISIGGIVEIIPHIFKIKKLIKGTVHDILSKEPDIVLTIDSPGFCFRIAKLLKRKSNIKLVHLVAPSVWAWRAKRAKKVAKLYNHLMTLFDFEPPYFEKEGLKTTFVGHPAVENFCASESQQKTDTVVLMPGSRSQEVTSLLPIFIEASKTIGKDVVVPTLPHLVPLIRSIDSNIPVETDESEKMQLYKTAKMAIVASGTATLQLALANCPMIVCYKISNVSFQIIKRMVSVKYISLVNIILGRSFVPELIQDDCTAVNIVKIANSLDLLKQIAEFKKLRQRLTSNGQNPSSKIADIILNEIDS